jgi:hypothetical protein
MWRRCGWWFDENRRKVLFLSYLHFIFSRFVQTGKGKIILEIFRKAATIDGASVFWCSQFQLHGHERGYFRQKHISASVTNYF